jgi:hypothetical protein
MKKAVSLILASVLCMSLCACGVGNTVIPETESTTIPTTAENRIAIPDIADVDETTAKTILSSNTLIPSIKYVNDDVVDEGNVIKTEPAIGTKVDPNTKIVIYISTGPAYLESSDARVEWYYLSDKEDKWEFSSPYIRDGVLYIECYNVTFGCAMEWKDPYNKGKLIGVASITDSFDKKVPVSAKYQKQSWKANESQKFTLEIPLSELSVSRPTDIYLRLYTVDDGDVKVNFYMSWK